MNESLNQYTSALKSLLNAHKQAMGLTYFKEYDVYVHETPKYFKVHAVEVKDTPSTNPSYDQRILSFIDKSNGDILKPASYKVPAKHARGNINSLQHGMEAHMASGSVIYLK